MKKILIIFVIVATISLAAFGKAVYLAVPPATFHFNTVINLKTVNMQTKLCTGCGEEKSLSDFQKCKTTKTGIQVYCRICQNNNSQNHQKTKSGLISKIYVAQKLSSQRRGRNMPTYTKDELKDWCFSQKLFHELYDNWKADNFRKGLNPSCDRIDNHKGYSLDNLQLMTWNENDDKGKVEKMKAVIGTHKVTGNKIEFRSQKEAAIFLNSNSATISACCKGRTKSSAGYTWQYKTI